MNRKISQFELTNTLQEQDLLTIVQGQSNKNITKTTLTTSLSDTFATNVRVDGVEESVEVLDTKVDKNYSDLSAKIIEGDTNVTTNINSTITSYYDVLNNKIIVLDEKHDTDISEVTGTVQEWIDDIDNRSTLQQLQDALNRLTIAENTITALAEVIANGGGSSGEVPGYHTQGTNTIFPLSGYYKTFDTTDLTVTDTLNQALGKLESKVDSIGSSGGFLPIIKTGETTTPTDKNIYTAAKTQEEYLSKTHDDVENGYIRFTKGLQGGTAFSSGFMGYGASLYPLHNKWNLEVDNLFVRGSMTVNELIVNEIKATGGDILVTVADMKCIAVEDDGYGDYKCYFDSEDGTKYNQFREGDQAICQIFDGKNVKRYWRMVKETGEDYIVLSSTVCEAGSAIPAAGDNILQLGNRYPNSTDRRSAIMISAKGEKGPTITFYENIDDFDLTNKDRTQIGRDSKFVGTLMQVSGDGDLVRVPMYRGQWRAETTYYYYDQVTYKGELWLCMATSTTTEPSATNEEWLLQVEKGENGKPGADVAKWAEIIGDRLFMYNNPKFEGTPDPTSLQLLCNTYGMVDPVYEWTNKNTGAKIGTTSTISITPDMFGEDRNLKIRCTVNDEGDIYYDETQLAKLGDGSQGADAYYIDLSNGSITVPYDAAGVNPLVDLNTIYTDVAAYKGTKEVSVQSISAKTTSGIATVNATVNKVTLLTLGSTSAVVTLTLVIDNIQFTKDLRINKVRNGENGYDGTDASYVMVTGEQTFKYDKKSVVTPSTIKLLADTSGIIDPVFKWEWSVTGNNQWSVIDNETTSILTVSPTGDYFTNTDQVSFKASVVSKFGGNTYTDVITILKLYDGKDGENVYRGVLTNENHTIPALYDGGTADDDLRKATTHYTLWYGTTELKTTEYSIRYRDLNDTTLNELSQNETNKTLTVASLGKKYDSTVFKVEFIVPRNGTRVVDTRDFSISKAKAAPPAPVELFAYCRYNGLQAATPTLTTPPMKSGSYSEGNYWYPTQMAADGYYVWVSTATTNPMTGLVSSDGWSTPNVLTGKDGQPGTPGVDGIDGQNGSELYFAYKISATQPEMPTGQILPPVGWLQNPGNPTKTEFLWMTQAEISGNGAVGGWSSPIRLSGLNGKDGEDGTDIEFIYTRTATNSRPNTPDTVQQEDYIPSGWTDNPQGVTAALLYEWVSTRNKPNGSTQWSKFSIPSVWAKWGEKGMDGDGYEYIYKRTNSSTAPAKPTQVSQDDDFVPTGWTDDPTGVNNVYQWEWTCTRKKNNGKWGEFSAVALWAKFGEDGAPGLNGNDGAPGEKGDPGEKGSPGDPGPQGPGLNYVGEWNYETTYYKNEWMVDLVHYDGAYWINKYDGNYRQYPDRSPALWEKMNSFVNIATGLLFAEIATIGGWHFTNNFIYSTDRRVYLNANGGNKDTPVFACGLNAIKTGVTVDSTAENYLDPNAALKIFAGGTITVGDGVASANAGLTGQGTTDDSVRFWAGAIHANRGNAPFRVTQGGNVRANNCELTGSFSTSAGGKRVTILSDATYGGQLSIYDGSKLVAQMNSYNLIYSNSTNSVGISANGISLNYNNYAASIAIDTGGFLTLKGSIRNESTASSGSIYKDFNNYLKYKP